MASSQEQRPNLLCCRPVRRVEAVEEEGHVVVLRPRFLRGPLAWWLQPRLRRPHFRVKLDPIGSFIWRRCDGETTVAQLAEAMEQEFGDGAEQAVSRIEMFLGELARGEMVGMIVPGTAGGEKAEERAQVRRKRPPPGRC